MAVRSLKNENVSAFSHQLCSMESYLGKEISRRRSCHFSCQVFSKRFHREFIFLWRWLLKLSFTLLHFWSVYSQLNARQSEFVDSFGGDFLLNPASLWVCCFRRLLKYWIFFTPGRHFPLMGTVSNEINKTAIKISEKRNKKEWSRVSETLFQRRVERISKKKTKASENCGIEFAEFLHDLRVFNWFLDQLLYLRIFCLKKRKFVTFVGYFMIFSDYHKT